MQIRSTTILGVRYKGQTALGGDGQVTMGNTAVKHGAVKIRRLGSSQVLSGFAGSASDAIALFERFESKLEEYHGNLMRAAVEMGKDWRTDRVLRRLEALLAVADKESTLILSGTGDIIEPDDGVIGIGSGGPIATAAARGILSLEPDLTAAQIVKQALEITSEICIYTNNHISVEEL
ncbi:MAG: ATP-dependent protease subunit HslV [Nitrospinaceae bacterium]|nr:ATP-dependent protease subunit HslV [Nitrospinaceae bacterium]MBT3435970.1 ATP-dependent protease subunit HslV [Nitrospinaceae bacterium]MBT3821044.1 ATP-dependent protease subunit HslV [Nitrospinaceae bacterium]MBT4429966.1 ATP-dependent protease subunit HslV [Nitrospinaceae bacterium]MBT5367424.1 ATP-dependent protease subunit HslV [Nitrospinaceae bacterium]